MITAFKSSFVRAAGMRQGEAASALFVEHSARQGTLALLIEEPSTRTRLSTAVAAAQIGLTPIAIDSFASLSIAKGESFADSASILSSYFDLIAVRSKLAGLSRLLQRYSSVPVLNLGDGPNEHPTQAVSTILTIRQRLPHVDRPHIVLWGDLTLNRTAHSVLIAAAALDFRITLRPFGSYAMPPIYVELASMQGSPSKPQISVAIDDSSISGAVDVLYLTREQHERRAGGHSLGYEPSADLLSRSGVILHPLPRGPEIDAALWHRERDGLLAHVRTTFLTRKWILQEMFTLGYGKGDPLEEFAIHRDDVECRNPGCITSITPELSSPVECVDLPSLTACAWCLHAVARRGGG